MNPLLVFVASSSEQLDTAVELAAGLSDGSTLLAYPWTEKTFTFSDTYIESLENELDRADFGVVVMTASDSGVVRRKKVNLPRDNVVFELGLFMGRLGRKRCFFLVDEDSDTTIASDLTGVKPAGFSRRADPGNRASFASVARALREQMLGQPRRHKLNSRSREAQEELWRFSDLMTGHYWERMKWDSTDIAISFLTVTIDAATGAPRMEGQAYKPDAEFYGDWHSVSSCVVPGGQPRVLYYWEGSQADAPDQTYGGGGHIRFDTPDLRSAVAHHYDTNLALVGQGATTTVRRHGVYRAEDGDAEVMKQPSSREAKALLQRRMETLQPR